VHHRKCTLAQTPLNCSSCHNCTTCRPLILAIDRPPHEYLGCFVAMFVHNKAGGRKNIGLVIDYDDSTKKYEILMEEAMIEASFTFAKLFATVQDVKQFLRWNPRRHQMQVLLQKGNYIIYILVSIWIYAFYYDLIVYCVYRRETIEEFF